MEKRERRSNFIFSIILRLFGRISSSEQGNGAEMFGMDGEVVWNFMHPYLHVLDCALQQLLARVDVGTEAALVV